MSCVGAHAFSYGPPLTGSWTPLCHPIKKILESPLPGGLSLLSLLLSKLGCMDAQGVIAQNRTILPIQTIC